MRTIYIAGNFLSSRVGVRGAGEDLAEKLRANGWKVITASSHPGRLKRVLDLLWTAWSRRKSYQIAAVEVYSDHAFRWAELLGQRLLCFDGGSGRGGDSGVYPEPGERRSPPGSVAVVEVTGPPSGGQSKGSAQRPRQPL